MAFPGLSFDRRVSFGSLLQAVSLLIAVVGAYFVLKSEAEVAQRTADRAERMALQNAQHISETLKSINRLTTNVEVLSNTMDMSLQMHTRESQRLQQQLNQLKTNRAGARP